MADDDRLVREGLEVVEIVAHKLSRKLGRRVPFDDLRSAGREALVAAIRSYDPTKAGFRTYAAHKVKWGILDGFRRETHGRAVAARAAALAASERFAEGFSTELAEGEFPTEDAYQDRFRAMLAGQATALAVGLVVSFADLSSVPAEATGADEQLSQAAFAAEMRAAVADLPPRERALVERHYFGGERFDAIAADLGISKSRASRIHAEAISTLSRTLEAADR